MGMPPLPDEPPEYGDDILHVFPAGKTPKYIYATFHGIIKRAGTPAEGPYNATFKLTQHPTITRRYVLTPGPPIISVDFETTYTFVTFETVTAIGVFLKVTYSVGVLFFANAWQETPPVGGYYDGICILSWVRESDGSILDAADLFGIQASDTLYGQALPDSDSQLLFAFADDAARLKMRIKKDL